MLDTSKVHQAGIDQAAPVGFRDVFKCFLGCKGHQHTNEAADQRHIVLIYGLPQELPQTPDSVVALKATVAHEVNVALRRLPSHVFIQRSITNQGIHNLRAIAGKEGKDPCQRGRHGVAEQVKWQLARQRKRLKDDWQRLFRPELRQQEDGEEVGIAFRCVSRAGRGGRISEDLDESGDHQVTVFAGLPNCLDGQLPDARIETGNNPIQLRGNSRPRRHVDDVQHLLQVDIADDLVVLDRLQRVLRQHPIHGHEVRFQ